jgi:hypothetical protein
VQWTTPQMIASISDIPQEEIPEEEDDSQIPEEEDEPKEDSQMKMYQRKRIKGKNVMYNGCRKG